MDTRSRIAVSLRNTIHPFILLLTKTRVKYKIHIEKAPVPLRDKPVIFAINHTNSFDVPIVAEATWRTMRLRSMILAGKQNLWLSDKLFFYLNGVIWVDRKSKKEMAAVKNILIDYLNKKQAIMWSPEGTWNLTDNLLMLPMKWGIIDVASQAGAQIIPVVLDYNRKSIRCCVSFGMPIAPDETTDKADAIRELRDAMATLRWELWEKQAPPKA